MDPTGGASYMIFENGPLMSSPRFGTSWFDFIASGFLNRPVLILVFRFQVLVVAAGLTL